MTIEERLAHLVEHGVGCPQAVRLGGPAAVEAWCEQEEITLEAKLADAEATATAEAEATAEADAERDARDAERNAAAEAAAATAEATAEAAGETIVTGSDPEEVPPPTGLAALDLVHARLDRLEKAVEAFEWGDAAPPVEAVEAVAASPKPKGKKKAGKK